MGKMLRSLAGRWCRRSLISILLGGLGWSLTLMGHDACGQEKSALAGGKVSTIQMIPVGRVERRDNRVFVAVEPAYAQALDGIEDFSQIWVIYWFHGNDTPEGRRTLKVHPRGNPANPLTGVFATRSPRRPNLLALQSCRLVRREGNRLEVQGLDAWDGSPVVDIKPYLPQLDAHSEAVIPAWAQGKPPE